MDTLKGLPTKKLGGFAETDSEIQFLENLFNEDCKCRSTHMRPLDIECSVAVTHVTRTSCGMRPQPALICNNAARISFMYMANHHIAECGHDASECWIITPI